VSWETLLWQVPVAILSIASSIAILLKTITGGYGKVTDALGVLVKTQGEQIQTQAVQIKNLQLQLKESAEDRMNLHKLRKRDRRRCNKEMVALKDELMTKIKQCPVLMGEAPIGPCPMVVERRRRDDTKEPLTGGESAGPVL